MTSPSTGGGGAGDLAGASPGSGRWVEVRVAVPGPDAERVAQVLEAVAPAGAAIEHGFRASDGGDWLARPTASGEAQVRVWLPAPAEPRPGVEDEACARVRAALNPLGLAEVPEPEATLVEPPDWSREWRRFYRPLRVGRLLISPPWENLPSSPGEVRVVIDPGGAFGTGHHESTRLCLRALDSELVPGSHVVDLGTGSGIFAVAAALLGAASVRALDTDPEAVEAAGESARLNGVGGRVVVAAGSLGGSWPWRGSGIEAADLLLANLSGPLVAQLAPDLARLLRPGGIVVTAGYLAGGAPDVREALRSAGLRTLRVESEGEWRCHVARREAHSG